MPDDERDERHEPDDDLELAQQREANLVGLADLQDGAVEQPRRGELEHGAPIVRERAGQPGSAAVQILDLHTSPRPAATARRPRPPRVR